MKKLGIFALLFALLVSCVFPFASAFGIGDVGEAETFEQAFPLTVYTTVGGEASQRVEYSPYEWPVNENHNIVISNGASVSSLFSCSGLSFQPGTGFGVVTVVLTGSDFWNYFSSLQIYLQSKSSLNFCVINCYEDGTYKVTNGMFGSGVFDGSPEVFYSAEDGVLNLGIFGDLAYEVASANFRVVPNEGFPESYTLNYSSSFFTFVSGDASQIPVVDSVSLSASSPAPYYPGTDVQLNATVNGTGIVPGSPESSLYWYVHGNTSPDTYLDENAYGEAVLHIANDETAISLEIEAISTYDTTKSAILDLPITYPLEGVQIVPSGEQKFVQSDKQREIQYQLLLPNGDPYNYQLIEWYAQATPGHEKYFRIDDTGLLVIAPDAPAGSGCTIQFAYQSDPSALSPVGASVQIISQLDGIIDGITPTPDQSDKADQMEDAIGDAAGKLENNNSSLEQLTPSRPQINTDLKLDEEKLAAVSPLVTNIWSISGMTSLIGIVVLVATVAYIFFGKRSG